MERPFPFSGVVDDGRVFGAVLLWAVLAGMKKDELDEGEGGWDGYPSLDVLNGYEDVRGIEAFREVRNRDSE
jgi:hypothetical protein